MDLTTGDIITSETFGTRVTAQSADQRIGATIRYDATQLIKIRGYGQYQAVSTSATVNDYNQFQIKQGSDMTYEPVTNLIDDPSLILQNTTYGTLTLPTNSYNVVYDFNLDTIPDQGENTFFKGIQFLLDGQSITGLEIQVQIKSSSGVESNIKSIIFSDEAKTITLGDNNDMWGLVSDDIILQDLSIEITFNNTTLSQITPSFKNLQIVFYWMNDETYGALGFNLKGSHSRVYQLYMTDDSNPAGISPKYNTLQLNKTDGELPIQLDIQSKNVDPVELKGFNQNDEKQNNPIINNEDVEKIINLINSCKRPIIIVGNGVRLSKATEKLLSFIDKFKIPVVTTKNAMDLIYDNHPLLAGRMGTGWSRA